MTDAISFSLINELITSALKLIMVLIIFLCGSYYIIDHWFFPDTSKDHFRVAISPFTEDNSIIPQEIKKRIESAAECFHA